MTLEKYIHLLGVFAFKCYCFSVQHYKVAILCVIYNYFLAYNLFLVVLSDVTEITLTKNCSSGGFTTIKTLFL